MKKNNTPHDDATDHTLTDSEIDVLRRYIENARRHTNKPIRESKSDFTHWSTRLYKEVQEQSLNRIEDVIQSSLFLIVALALGIITEALFNYLSGNLKIDIPSGYLVLGSAVIFGLLILSLLALYISRLYQNIQKRRNKAIEYLKAEEKSLLAKLEQDIDFIIREKV